MVFLHSVSGQIPRDLANRACNRGSSPTVKRMAAANPSLAEGHFAVMIGSAKPLEIAAKSRRGAQTGGRLTFSRSRGYSHDFVAI